MEAIRSKTRSVELLRSGAFGNTMQLWDTLEAFLTSRFQGNIGIRYKETKGGGFWVPNVPWDKVAEATRQLVAQGAKRELIFYTEMCDHARSVVSGEVARFETGYLDLTYSRLLLPLREAIAADPHYVHGIVAVVTLKHLVGEEWYDWFMHLLDEYPGHVVEFSTFERPLGILGEYTVVWEVRQY